MWPGPDPGQATVGHLRELAEMLCCPGQRGRDRSGRKEEDLGAPAEGRGGPRVP